jgi:DNA-binding protein H-NS
LRLAFKVSYDVKTPTRRLIASDNVQEIALDNMTVQELMGLRERIESTISQKQQAARSELLDKWRTEAMEHGLPFEELVRSQPKPATPEKVRKRKTSSNPVAPKFRNPETSETWSGRGREPKWIKGKDRAEFAIKA